MTDKQKTEQELIQELDILRQRVETLEQSESARKRAEEALRESEEKYRAVFENTGAASVVIEENSIISLANAEFVRLSGYSLAEIEGKKSWTEFVVKEDLERMQTQHRLRRQNAEKALRHYEFRFVPRDGNIRNISLSIDMILGTTKSVASLLDITERKRAEEALYTEKQRFQSLSEQAPFGMVMIHQDGTFKYMNSKFRELFGYELTDVPDGKTWFRKAYPDTTYRHHVIGTWMKDLKVSKPGEKRCEVFTVTCKDGTKRIISFLPVQLETGENLMACEDISERKQVEAALQKSEEQLKLAIEGSGVGLWDWRVQTGETVFNDRWAQIVGYTLMELTPISINTWIGLVHPDDLHRWDEFLKKHFAGEIPVCECEARMRHKDGHWVWVLDRGKVTKRDADGKPVRMTGTHLDITERKRVEEALRESTTRYDELVRRIPVGVFVLRIRADGSMVFEYESPQICQILGLDEGALLRDVNLAFAIAHPEDRDNLIRITREAGVNLKPFRWEGRFVVRGETRWVRIESDPTPLPSGDSLWNGVISDITERKRAEEALRESEERLRLLFDEAPVGYHEVDTEGRVIRINRTELDLLGYCSEDVIGRPIWRLCVDEEAVIKAFKDKIAGKAPPGRAFERSYRRKDGTPLPVLSEDRILRDKDGRITGIRTTIQDITERKRAEEALQKSEEQAKQLAQENAIIAEIGRIVSSTLNISEVYERFAQQVQELISFDRVSINLIDHEAHTATAAYSSGRGVKGRQTGDVYPLEGTAADEIIRTHSGLLLHTQGKEELERRFPGLVPSFQAEHRSMMVVPLISKGKIIADLYFGSAKSNSFSDRDLRLAELIGAQIAGAIANAQLFIERKQMEEALRESEERFRELFDHAPVSYHEYDLEGRITRVNRTELELLGYAHEEMIGKPIWKFNAEEESARKRILAKLAGEIPASKGYELIYRRKDGAIISLLAEDRLILDSEGRITGMRGIFQDITERKQMEKALYAEKQRFQALSENAPFGMLMIDQDGSYRYVNPKFRELFGYDLTDLPDGKTWFRKAYPEPTYRHNVISVWAEDFRTPKPGMRRPRMFTTTCKDGSEKFVNFISVQLETGETLMACEDITERRHAEEALRRSETQANQLAQENAIMAEIGRIISSTPNIDEVYDRFAGEARKLISFDRININIINPEEKTVTAAYGTGSIVSGRQPGDVFPLAGTALQKIMRTHSGLLVQTDNASELAERFPGLLPHFKAGQRSMMGIPLISKDRVIGGLFLGSDRLSAYTNRDLRLAESIGSQIAGAIANAQLFSERQRLEDRLRRAEKMEALGTLAGGVAHDLNNVLGVLVGYSELLLMEIPGGSPLRRHVSNILQSGQRAAAIIQDLLTLARRGVAVSEVVNLNPVISDYFKTPEFEKLRAYHPLVTFRTYLDKDLMNIKGSPIHLNKTIMNLLSNAAEAITEQGEVKILTENRYLDKPITGYDDIHEGDYVVLRVSDNGKGISGGDLGKIFEPFYTKKVMGRSGTGLGLAVVWGTVKDHGGYIDVQSEEGKGSTFTLYFPVTREERVNDQKEVSPESYMGGGESILVVDDVKEQGELAMAMLSGLGYRVNAVSSGKEAVAYVKTNKVDLLVLDMIMDPGMDGLETYQRVIEINPKQKAVIVSGFSETVRVKKAQELGAGAYVRKPYIQEKIGLAIRKELDK